MFQELLEQNYKHKILDSEEQVSRAMDLVNRVQVAASNSMERERGGAASRLHEVEQEVASCHNKMAMWRKSCEKLSRDNARLKIEVQVRGGEKERGEGFREERDRLKDELVGYKVMVARYEERAREVGGLKEEKEGLRLELKEREGECSALRDEVDRVLDMYQTNLAKVREVAQRKIEMEGEMRRRLQEEVREARSAITHMSKDVRDRNELLNNLEDRLGAAAEEKKGGRGGMQLGQAPEGAHELVEVLENVKGKRRAGEGLYGIAGDPDDSDDASPVVVSEDAKIVEVGDGGGGWQGGAGKRRTRDRMERREKQKREVRTKGGTAWVIS